MEQALALSPLRWGYRCCKIYLLYLTGEAKLRNFWQRSFAFTRAPSLQENNLHTHTHAHTQNTDTTQTRRGERETDTHVQQN